MKHTTNTSKVLIVAIALLGISISSLRAQTGRVGINTDDPKATLEVGATTTTGTQAEGLLIPRVSRAKAGSMTGVETSTLIFVNDISNGSQTGQNVNVDKTGYYYYDGSKWAFLANNTEWKYDANTKQIDLVRSGSAPFPTKIYFDKDGKYFNVKGNGTFEEYVMAAGTYKAFDPIVKDVQHSYTMMNASDIVKQSTAVPDAYVFKSILKRDVFNVDALPTGMNSATLLRSNMLVPTSNNQNMSSLFGHSLQVQNSSSGTTKKIIGLYTNTSSGGTNTVSNYLSGILNQTGLYSPKPIKNVYSFDNFTYDRRKSGGNTSKMIGMRNGVYFQGQNSIVKDLYGYYGYFRKKMEASVSITNAYGISFEGFSLVNAGYDIPSIQNYYGLYMKDVVGGISRNFAIYTNAGTVRFGDNVGIGVNTPTEKLEVNGTIKATKINFTGLPTYADDAAAAAGGLVAGDCYKTATGELRIKL